MDIKTNIQRKCIILQLQSNKVSIPTFKLFHSFFLFFTAIRLSKNYLVAVFYF